MDLYPQHTAAFAAYFDEYLRRDEVGRQQFDQYFEECFGADFAAIWTAWRRLRMPPE